MDDITNHIKKAGMIDVLRSVYDAPTIEFRKSESTSNFYKTPFKNNDYGIYVVVSSSSPSISS